MPIDDDEPDESTAQDVAAAARAALREVAELTGGGMAVDRPGWRYVPDAYRLLGQLTQLSELLPEVLEQIRGSVTAELELNLIAMDRGSPYEGRPDAAVQAMTDGIQVAVAAARQLNSGVAAAADGLTWAAYGGRRVDLVPGIPQVAVWKAPYPAGRRHPNGLVGTVYTAQCECGWPQLPAMVDRQTFAEADAEAHAHVETTGHLYQPNPDEG